MTSGDFVRENPPFLVISSRKDTAALDNWTRKIEIFPALLGEPTYRPPPIFGVVISSEEKPTYSKNGR